ncbi:MAG: translation initiation factor IF-2, partial [Candidatus Woesearchaeota archaeon]|nr:translation initiation factor IF-2 [Candidatus Woesearchaeota archaeon]
GVIIKADTLGSLEALSKLLQDAGVLVKRASVGAITKKDFSDAEANLASDPFNAVILGFNIPKPEQASIQVFCSDVIYRLLDEFKIWQEEQKIHHERQELHGLVSPAKILLLNGYVFRQSNPAVMGVEILSGRLLPNTTLMKENGQEVALVKQAQNEQKAVAEAKRGSRVSIAMPDVIVGRHIKEGEILYSMIPEEHFRKYKEMKETLTTDEKELLKEIAVIMRVKNPVWGV